MPLVQASQLLSRQLERQPVAILRCLGRILVKRQTDLQWSWKHLLCMLPFPCCSKSRLARQRTCSNKESETEHNCLVVMIS